MPGGATVRQDGSQVPDAEPTLTAADITPEHKRVLGLVPMRTVQAVARCMSAGPAGGVPCARCRGEAERDREITSVPYRTMREYSDRPGEMGLLMGKGLADSQRKAGGG